MDKLQNKYAVVALISDSGNLIICGTYTFTPTLTKLTKFTSIDGVLSDLAEVEVGNVTLEKILATAKRLQKVKVIHREVDNLDDAKLYVDSIICVDSIIRRGG